MIAAAFDELGFALLPDVLDASECSNIEPVPLPEGSVGGSRGLLSLAWCARLARRLQAHPAIRPLMPASHVAVQCTYFEKCAARNWLVGIHQDLSIPVARRVEAPELKGWSEKQGELFVQPPRAVLEELIALRLHVDPCGDADGPLRFVPGSHRKGIFDPASALAERASSGEVVCPATRGSVLAMRPLTLHASSKSTGPGRRRVLHFLFGPRELPFGLEWPAAM
ncbi:phytanoyl-CoA dioxygenase family protein [Ideonella sp. YS5]|uniref:phytanoyl-CoA dioxygenase family protein n=1 Tax=Ideonella sp. YS5 TaxID=3453714 RepID=UPI003EE9D211